jgi:hypothetical protein
MESKIELLALVQQSRRHFIPVMHASDDHYSKYARSKSRHIRWLKIKLQTLSASTNGMQEHELAGTEWKLWLQKTEREWAHSMAAKQQSLEFQGADDDQVSSSRKKFVVLKKLKRAVEYSEALAKTLSKSTQVLNFQAQAYHWTLKGMLDFESQKWSTAVEAFTLAR